jgi:hypothetical protein
MPREVTGTATGTATEPIAVRRASGTRTSEARSPHSGDRASARPEVTDAAPVWSLVGRYGCARRMASAS